MHNRRRLIHTPFLIDNNTMAYVFDESWDTDFNWVPLVRDRRPGGGGLRRLFLYHWPSGLADLLPSLLGEIAGFVLISLDVPIEYMKLSTAEKTNLISDFFIMRKHRRKGVGSHVAHILFDEFTGTWEIRKTLYNKPAYAFWKQIIGTYRTQSSYREQLLQNEKWDGPIFSFESGQNLTNGKR
ncbi:GNAT family N-acetyltransferase [Paenibacillus sp. USHLN196]|uniref:GNAT family N-acetyltransferase n=1 Tax=Paenibacillus sp. USHLN196 TaxID=3081291 RepID=UPI003019B7AD